MAAQLIGENLTATLVLLTRQGPVRPVDLLPLLPPHQRPADSRMVANMLHQACRFKKHGIRRIRKGLYGPLRVTNTATNLADRMTA